MVKSVEEQVFTRVWAPIQVSFTSWVLREALASNIHKLYFLARDARMSYVIAAKLVEQEKLPITCKYLEGSRFAWRMADFYLPDSDPIGKICVGGVRVTLRRILKRGGLTDAEAGQIAALLQLETSLDEPLSYADTVAMKPKLAACGQLLSMIRQHAGESYEATLDYFRQEGLLEKQPFGIVDSGWVGSLQQTLGRLLTAASGEEPGDRLHGFYFGLYELPHGVNKSLYHTFYFRPYRDIEKRSVSVIVFMKRSVPRQRA